MIESEATVPAHTGSRTTRLLGLATLAGIAVVLVLALAVTGPDAVQGDAARLIYLHVPVAIAMNIGFGLCTLGSVMWLWKKSRWWDTVAVSAAEVGLVFTGLTSVTGMVWGRPTWGVYWTWDARLTTFSLLFLLYLGYLVVRRLPADIEVRNRRSAFVALLAFVDVPIVYLSVSWWRGLHQEATLSLSTHDLGLMLFTLVLGIVVSLHGLPVAADPPLPRGVARGRSRDRRARPRHHRAARRSRPRRGAARRGGVPMSAWGYVTWATCSCSPCCSRTRCTCSSKDVAVEAGAAGEPPMDVTVPRSESDSTPDAGPEPDLTPRTLGEPGTARPQRKRKPGVYVLLALIVAAIGYVIFQGLNNAALYYRNADEAVAQKASLGTTGSACRAPCRTTWPRPATRSTSRSPSTAPPCRSTTTAAIRPSCSRPGIPVVLEGHWDQSGAFFDSDSILIKHSADYKEQNPDRVSSNAP